METNFAGSFFKSLENLIKRERWYNRLFDTIRYDIPRFCKNVWLIAKMKRLVYLLNISLEESYLELAEKEL